MSRPSADQQRELAALARAFARHLEHLRDYRGVAYVGGAAMPRSTAPPVDAPAAAAPVPVADAGAPAHAGAPARAAAPTRTPAPSVAREGEVVYRTSGEDSSSPLREAARAITTTRGQAWPAARKLAYLRERNVGDCRRCALARTRRNIVFGVGNPEADLMFIGEAPGADEDRLGEPFVGAAGRRLDRWIHALGLTREQVYIANVLKCRPPRNRDPMPDEIERCSPFLHAQIRAIEPRVIVALGRFAGNLLVGGQHKMYEMRGQVHRYREPKSGAEVPVVVTYHPSYVIRRESEPPASSQRPDRGGVIKSEDEKVLADLDRAVSLVRGSSQAT